MRLKITTHKNSWDYRGLQNRTPKASASIIAPLLRSSECYHFVRVLFKNLCNKIENTPPPQHCNLKNIPI